MSREARERMAEDFRTHRDALWAIEAARGHVKRYELPPYVRQKPAKGLADLLRDHPTAVSREPSEFRN